MVTRKKSQSVGKAKSRSRPTLGSDPCPDAPLRLSVAAACAFPDGSMTASGLRLEASRGRLVVERVAGKLYTTLRDIRGMRKLCRVDQKVLVSGFDRTDEEAMARSFDVPPGSSSTAAGTSPQDALRMKLQPPKVPSHDTSSPNTDRAGESAISKR